LFEKVEREKVVVIEGRSRIRESYSLVMVRESLTLSSNAVCFFRTSPNRFSNDAMSV